MSLKKYSHEEISRMSMIELANIILTDKKKAMDFRDVFKQISELKGFTSQEKEANITQFYTDLNIDGRFMTTGSNLWGLKRWYSVEQREEEVTAAPKKKKKATKAKTTKKKAKKKDKDEDFDIEEEELDIVDEDIEEFVDDLDDDYNDEDDDDDYDDDEDDYDDDDEEDKDEKKK